MPDDAGDGDLPTITDLTHNLIMGRSVLREYKEDESDLLKKVTEYWDIEVEKLEPLCVIKLTKTAQLPYAREIADAAEIGAISGYNRTRRLALGSKQDEHAGGGWPKKSIEDPDGRLPSRDLPRCFP
jgi:hypothetical protein